MIFKIAWRNIWRNKLRSLVIITAIILGVWAALFMIAFSWGMSEKRLSGSIDHEVGHVQIHHPSFLNEDGNIKYFIENGEELQHSLDTMQSTTLVSSRLAINAMIQSSRNGGGVRIIGIDPEVDAIFTQIDSKIQDGKYFNEKRGRKIDILISEKLADHLKVGVRKSINLKFSDSDGEFMDLGCRVLGIYKTSNPQYDMLNVFVRKDVLQESLGGLMVNELVLKLAYPEEAKQFAADFNTNHKEVSAKYWGEVAPELKLLNDSFDQGMQIFISIIMLALAFGIINTMLMAVLERVREIGVLMSIGLNKLRLFSMIVIETIFLAAIAAPLGMALAWLTIYLTNINGIDLSIVGQGLESYGYSTMVYPVLKQSYYMDMAVQVSVLAVVSSLYPAWKALKLNPVKAIRKI